MNTWPSLARSRERPSATSKSLWRYLQSSPIPGADDLAIMFDYFARGPSKYDIANTRKINPKTLRFEEWAEKNKEKLLKA